MRFMQIDSRYAVVSSDSAFHSISCNAKIHSFNKLASWCKRVWMCEQAPAKRHLQIQHRRSPLPPTSSRLAYSMETGQHVGVKIYQLVAMQFIFLVGIGSCIHSSSFSSEVGGSNSNTDSNNPNISTFSHFEKYIMKPYFENYDSLIDSYLQDFIEHELSHGSCEVLPDNLNLVLRLSILQRYLIGEGSHRRLSSSIRFNIHSEFIPELPTHFCEVIIIEKLPSGVFADPFELQHLLQHGVFTDAAVFGDTNLELPSVRSNRSLVEVHLDIGPNVLSKHKNGTGNQHRAPITCTVSTARRKWWLFKS
ncbi:hypothetical protein L1049_023046 [Liquidambar formosana]|uniref:Uncharacterized protein n=1 Tax=Liquidambar formosana TaxID=63359 RepID=A0AAP0REW6_LIQFO